MSSRHGGHQVAQKFTSTTLPFQSRLFIVRPSSVLNVSSGTGTGSLTKVTFGAGAPAFCGAVSCSLTWRVYRAAKIPRGKWDAADKIWRAHYAKQAPKLLPGARRVLSLLARRHALGLVTSGDRDRVHGQLRTFRLWEHFAARVCSGDTRLRKPHPAPLQLALRHMKLRPAETVFVGDSPEDLEMARRAGVRAAIAVLGPFPTEKRLRAVKPDLLLDSIAELPAALVRFQE